MKRPQIYIHRVGKWHSLYMSSENERALREFSDVISAGGREIPLSSEELVADMKGVDGILSLNGTGAAEITTEVLREIGTVKVAVVCHWWHGAHEKAKSMWEAAGVEVIDASDANNEAVAEWVVGVAIMGARRLVEFDMALKSGDPWGEPRGDAGLIADSVVGIIGLGRVGKIVARHFRALGAEVLGYDAYVPEHEVESLGVRMVSLEQLLRTADIVSLHLPVTDETRGIIGRTELSWIKDNAIFINSARAALLDNEALIAELKSKRFRAFLDVYATEPLPPDDPLRSMDNVFLTPHIAGYNYPMFRRCARVGIERLKQYFESL